MPAHITKINFAAQLSGKIDKQNNRLLGVTVMAANREATGHGEWADEQTLRSLVEVAKGVYPSQFGHPYYFDTIQPVIGSVSNFRIYDNKVIADIEFIPAADLHPSFIKSPIDYIFEMAQSNPEYINLSVSISRELVWIKQDGTEQDAFVFDNPPVDIIRKIPSIRVKKLHSVDFVTKGALTESLFSAKQGTKQMENETEQATPKIDLAAQVSELQTAIAKLRSDSETRQTNYATEQYQALHTAQTDLTAQYAKLQTEVDEIRISYAAALDAIKQLTGIIAASRAMQPTAPQAAPQILPQTVKSTRPSLGNPYAKKGG